jgi:hypothetical protein
MLLAKIGRASNCGTENKREGREVAIFAVFFDGWKGVEPILTT